MHHPDIAPYLVAPFTLTCAKDRHTSLVVAFARHGEAVLFFAWETGQFGVGVMPAPGTAEVDCFRCSSLEHAIALFVQMAEAASFDRSLPREAFAA